MLSGGAKDFDRKLEFRRGRFFENKLQISTGFVRTPFERKFPRRKTFLCDLQILRRFDKPQLAIQKFSGRRAVYPFYIRRPAVLKMPPLRAERRRKNRRRKNSAFIGNVRPAAMNGVRH